jgi:hypothetical protein
VGWQRRGIREARGVDGDDEGGDGARGWVGLKTTWGLGSGSRWVGWNGVGDEWMVDRNKVL